MRKRQNPTGQSLFLLLLSACGGGSSPPTPAPKLGDSSQNNQESSEPSSSKTPDAKTPSPSIEPSNPPKTIPDDTKPEEHDTPKPEESEDDSDTPVTDDNSRVTQPKDPVIQPNPAPKTGPVTQPQPDPKTPDLKPTKTNPAPDPAPAPIPDPAPTISLTVAENHDSTVALHTFTPPPGKLGGTFELTDDYIDNHLFTIDEITGMLHVTNFRGGQHIGGGNYTTTDNLDYENPFDRGYDNIYDLEVVWIAPDSTRHETQSQITVMDENERADQYYSYTFNFYSHHLSKVDQPPGDMKYIIFGRVPIMPHQGPLIIKWGIDLTIENNWLTTPEKVSQVSAQIEKAIAEFESSGANIDFVKSESTDPDDFDMFFEFTHLITDFPNYRAYGSGSIASGIQIRIGSDYYQDNLYHTLVHEMGHWMGLKHNFGLQGSTNDWPDTPDSAEWGKKTVMSREGDNTKIENALTDLDKSALRWLYGEAGKDWNGVEGRINYDRRWDSGREITIKENHPISTPISTARGRRDDTDTIYRIKEGYKDGDLFRINEQTGKLYFIESPDYENPSDRYGGAKFSYNNIYHLATEVSSYDLGDTYSRLNYTVFVTDVIEIA